MFKCIFFFFLCIELCFDLPSLQHSTEQSGKASGQMHMALPAAPCFQSAAISEVIDVFANWEAFFYTTAPLQQVTSPAPCSLGSN